MLPAGCPLLQVSNTFNSDLAEKAKAIDEVSPAELHTTSLGCTHMAHHT
jgi:hypothetical protein